MNGYFITGTDTNAGKTYVSCALARRAVALGHKVLAFKPIETGCLDHGSGLRGEDQERLAQAAGDWQTGPLRGVYRFPLPAAPLVAAEQVGSSIDLSLLEQTARSGFATGSASFLLVEGAGGWRVPITREADMAALAQRFGLRVLIAARAGLGTINHSLLTIEAVERDGLQIGALVLSELEADDHAATLSNRAEISRRWPGRVLVLRADETVPDLDRGSIARPGRQSPSQLDRSTWNAIEGSQGKRTRLARPDSGMGEGGDSEHARWRGRFGAHSL